MKLAKQKQKQAIVGLVISIICLLMFTTAMTFAYFTARNSAESDAMQFGTLEIVFTGSGDNKIGLSNEATGGVHSLVPGCTISVTGEVTLGTSTIDAFVRLKPEASITSTWGNDKSITKEVAESQLNNLIIGAFERTNVWLRAQESNNPVGDYVYYAGKFLPSASTAVDGIKAYDFATNNVAFTINATTFGNDWQGCEFAVTIVAEAIQADHVGVTLTGTAQTDVNAIAGAKATGETNTAWSGIGGEQQNTSNLASLVNANKIELVANTGNVGTVGSEYKFGKVTIDSTEYDIEWQLLSTGDDGYGLLVAKYMLPASVMGIDSQRYFYKDQNNRKINTTTDTTTEDAVGGDIMDINANNYYYSNVRAYLNSIDGRGYNVGNYTSTGLSSLITNWNDIKDCVGRVNVCYADTATAQGVSATTGYQKGTGIKAKTTYASTKDANGDYFFLLSYDDCRSGGYFTDNASRIHNKIEDNTTAYYWWLRSPYTTFADIEYYVSAGGSVSSCNVDHSYGLVPALFIKL